MKSQIVLAAALLATLSTIGASQEYAFEKKTHDEASRVTKLNWNVQSLVGIRGISLLIEDLGENAKAAGLAEDQLRTDIEMNLRQAGIKVNSKEEYLASGDRACLYVNVSALKRDDLFIYSISVEVTQTAVLVRRPNRICPSATTWQSGAFGSVGATYFVETIRSRVKDNTNDFINDYLTANPKQ